MIEFNTTEFEFSHGKQPRGHGDWAFLLQAINRADRVIWIHGSYGEAKKQARKTARELRYYRVKVLP